MAKTPAQAQRTINGWMDPANMSTSAQLGRQLALGDWLTPEWMRTTMGANLNTRGLLSQVTNMFRVAGFHVEKRPDPGHPLAKQYRIRGGSPRPEPTLDVVQPESVPSAGISQQYPVLGASLTVRALALTDDGGVLLHLSDGEGGAWQAQITGWVEQK